MSIEGKAQLADLVLMDDADVVMAEVIKMFKTPQEIEALEGELLAAGGPEIHVRHSFAKGLYAREITIPRGFLAIGHAHSDECLNIVVKGSVSVLIDNDVKIISAPATFTSPPFTRKVGYVHDDLTWITVHATELKDIGSLEKDLIIKSNTFKQYEDAEKKRLEFVAAPRDELWLDRVDYFKVLKEKGMTSAQVRKIVENMNDQVDFPPGTGESVYVGSSSLHGNGIFAAYDIPAGKKVAPARIGLKRTKVGRYANHAKYPNCKFIVDRNGDMFITSLIELKKGDELTVDYRQAFRAAREADKILNN